MTAVPLDYLRFVSLLWASADHAGEIAALHAGLFDPPWDEASVRALLDHPAATSFIAFDGRTKRTVGFVIGQLAADEAEIISIGVVKGWQRRGLAKRMLQGLMRAAERAEAKRLFLEVAADNEAALALYRSLGFREAGRRREYYHQKTGAADALMLARELGPQPPASPDQYMRSGK